MYKQAYVMRRDPRSTTRSSRAIAVGSLVGELGTVVDLVRLSIMTRQWVGAFGYVVGRGRHS